MLCELTIKNMAVIAHVCIEFSRGLHVFTGETGAGKSIVIDALQLILGGRSSAEIVRHGAVKAEVEALFSVNFSHPSWKFLQENGIDLPESEDDDGHIIIRRDVHANGKSTARINGQLVTLTLLKTVGQTLVTIHGQHDHQLLMRPEQQRMWLDTYGGPSLATALQAYTAHYTTYKEVCDARASLMRTQAETLRLIDLYRYQVDEIRDAALEEHEEATLLQEKTKRTHAEKLCRVVAEGYTMLYEGDHGLHAVSRAMHALAEVVRYDEPALQPLYDQMQVAYYQLEDVAFELRNYRDRMDIRPERLEQLEERWQLLGQLKRKYGETIAHVIAYGVDIEEKLHAMEQYEQRLLDLAHQEDVLLQHVKEAAAVLTAQRTAVAGAFAAAMKAQLQHLHMDRTRFEVQVTTHSDTFQPSGCDRITLLIAPNLGEPLRPLAKIASGGECSRLMLALKAIESEADDVVSLVFDEVDTGVSGRAAQAIAEKLAHVAQQGVQVFVVTHLPQVACMADVHYEIKKNVVAQRTTTHVEALDPATRRRELARMLGGVAVTDTTLQHADEMIQMAMVHKDTWRQSATHDE